MMEIRDSKEYRAAFTAAKARLAEELKRLDDEGFPSGLLGDVTLSMGIFILAQSFGRDDLANHLVAVASRIVDPSVDLAKSWKQ